ncbi:MAG: diacylglycerol/polyprenol kinase family protein [Candidatus Aenigmatarchaeota archaeon]
MGNVEFRRQIIHLSGVSTVPLSLIYGKFTIGVLSIILSLIILTISEYYKRKEGIKNRLPFEIGFLEKIENIFYDTINSFEREEYIKQHPYFGAFTFFLSIGVIFLLLPLKIACLAVTVLAVGDSSATLIGSTLGKHRTPIDRSKTWEGTIGGLISSIIACTVLSFYIEISTNYIFIAPIVGMLAEIFSRKINDNLIIPISIAAVLLMIEIL